MRSVAIKSLAVVLLLSAILMAVGCRRFMNREGYFADTYCGENTKLESVWSDDVMEKIHYYEDSEYGFKYYVYISFESSKVQDFDIYVSSSKYNSDFDMKYVEAFLDGFDLSELEDHYGISVLIEKQDPTYIMQLNEKYNVSGIRYEVSCVEPMLFIITEDELDEDDEELIIDTFREAVEDFDTRGHFDNARDIDGTIVHSCLKIVLISGQEPDLRQSYVGM